MHEFTQCMTLVLRILAAATCEESKFDLGPIEALISLHRHHLCAESTNPPCHAVGSVMETKPDTAPNGAACSAHPEPTFSTADTTSNPPQPEFQLSRESSSANPTEDVAGSPRTYPKRLLPSSLSSAYPHGLITSQPRTTSQQAAFESRKAEILQTMSDEQIEERYQETVKKVEIVLKEIEEGNERIDREIEAARKTRETERKAWANLKNADTEG